MGCSFPTFSLRLPLDAEIRRVCCTIASIHPLLCANSGPSLLHCIAMGFIFRTVRRLATVGLVGTSGAAAYLAARNPVISPLSPSDPVWTSSLYKKHNPSRNPATQDVCIKRIPLDKIRPELLQKDGDLALEFCRGVWSGWGSSSSWSPMSGMWLM